MNLTCSRRKDPHLYLVEAESSNSCSMVLKVANALFDVLILVVHGFPLHLQEHRGLVSLLSLWPSRKDSVDSLSA